MSTGKPKETQAVEDGCFEAAHRAEGRVDVERIAVAIEPVQCRLAGQRAFFGRVVRVAGGWRGGGRRPAGRDGGFVGPAEATGSTDEDGRFVVEDFLPCGRVRRGGADDDDGSGAFVDDFEEARGGD